MAQISNGRIHWSLIVSRMLFGVSTIIAMLVLRNLTNTVHDQERERNCRFELTTETDRIDSEIQVKEAKIFEAAILRPAPSDGTSAELRELANQLQVLIKDRQTAFDKRDAAAKECD